MPETSPGMTKSLPVEIAGAFKQVGDEIADARPKRARVRTGEGVGPGPAPNLRCRPGERRADNPRELTR